MSNLVIANVRRLFKNRAFRIANAVIAVLALFQIVMIYQDYRSGMGLPYYDSALFSISAVGIFAIAAVVSLFIGSEYSDGTIRNKLVVGHGRMTIYLSLLITSIIAGWTLVISWSLAYLIPGMILLEASNPLWVFVNRYLALFLELAVFSAIFTLLTMVFANKAGSAVACILLGLVLLMQGIVINSILDETEYYSPDYCISVDGEVEYAGELIPNPNYLPEGSAKREFYEFMMDFTPGGQALEVAGHHIETLGAFALYDAGWIIAATGIGLLAFRRKDLK